MPSRHHAARRHHIPQARHRVRNRPEYEAGLRWRGDLALWLDGAAMAGWRAPRRRTPGGQARYSDLAIGLVPMARLVFHPARAEPRASPPACSGCSGESCASPVIRR